MEDETKAQLGQQYDTNYGYRIWLEYERINSKRNKKLQYAILWLLSGSLIGAVAAFVS